ncbi:hypothetical protein BJ085DRAFT_32254 [Dimargaris cristalligena]|uniref:Uncharacterized protein n=1 Tax=Dimargaris cristalligena TaxID=215637 RepID=A0A4Q0A0L5_9FUNG|nr:hypothetical protein BJ085DRAFT_32254 [Dimargaris cristalligena]|eukprot:RKP38812.1 hypothetical protein BJ085DRAFT_32254 [Dimargaris cristalligena]
MFAILLNNHGLTEMACSVTFLGSSERWTTSYCPRNFNSAMIIIWVILILAIFFDIYFYMALVSFYHQLKDTAASGKTLAVPTAPAALESPPLPEATNHYDGVTAQLEPIALHFGLEFPPPYEKPPQHKENGDLQ